MGYESKIMVVEKHNNDYVEKLATINMCKMIDEFRELFTKEIDYELYVNNNNQSTKTDRYGCIIKSAEPQIIIEWLEKEILKDDYRRLKPLLGLLKGFNKNQWKNIEIVHYGY